MNLESLIKLLNTGVNAVVSFCKNLNIKNISGILLTVGLLVSLGLGFYNIYHTNAMMHETMTGYRDSTKQDMTRALVEYEHAKDSIRNAEEQNTVVNQEIIKSQLNFWRKEIGCDRIVVAQLHNGATSLSGCLFVKLDITYTSQDDDVARMFDIENYQNIHISRYNIIPHIWKNSVLICSLDDIAEKDKLLYDQIRKYTDNIDSCVLYKLSIDNTGDGIVMFLFEKGVPVDQGQVLSCKESIEDLLHR